MNMETHAQENPEIEEPEVEETLAGTDAIARDEDDGRAWFVVHCYS